MRAKAKDENTAMKCRLCHQDAILQQSHVVPEFFYRSIYDKKHRLFQRIGGRLVKASPLQKGPRERLLCCVCERKLSRHEKYVSEVLFGGTKIGFTDHGNWFELVGLNYLSVRLCFLSVLWRMSIASGQAWQEVQLGTHEERLRSMIHAESPGDPTDYAFFCVAPLLARKFFAGLVLTPDCVRWEGRHYYRLILAGLIVVFSVSKKPMPAKYQEWAITCEGRWVIPREDAAKVPFLLEEVKRIVRARRDEA